MQVLKELLSTLEVLQTSISIENALIRINPMVFGRLTTLIKHKYEKVQQFIRELTPEPTSLFTDEYMRKQNKSILCNHIWRLVPTNPRHLLLELALLLEEICYTTCLGLYPAHIVTYLINAIYKAIYT